MSLSPTPAERRARARADLRMGLPVCLSLDGQSALVVATETLGPDRYAELASDGTAMLAITARRAETLKARAYDGDIARIPLGASSTLDWVQAVADPADDLSAPMKGPFRTERGGDCGIGVVALPVPKRRHNHPLCHQPSRVDRGCEGPQRGNPHRAERRGGYGQNQRPGIHAQCHRRRD